MVSATCRREDVGRDQGQQEAGGVESEGECARGQRATKLRGWENQKS